jgi:hypothetical protein
LNQEGVVKTQLKRMLIMANQATNQKSPAPTEPMNSAIHPLT